MSMKSLRRHIDPWEQSNSSADELFDRLSEMSSRELDGGWNCWIGSVRTGVSVLVWCSAEETPFRSSGSADEVVNDFAAWLARRKEQAPAHRPRTGEDIRRPDRARSIAAFEVIRDLEALCPRCRCALQEVEAREEGADVCFRYARCPRCGYGESLR
jgi:hypothetical protein